LTLGGLFRKYEMLDVRREHVFVELMKTLNETLQNVFREFNESSSSKYVVKKWQAGVTRFLFNIRLPNGRVYPGLGGKCRIIIIVKELVDRNTGERYDIDRPLPNNEDIEKLERELSRLLDRRVGQKVRRYIDLYFYKEPDYPVEYAEVVSLSFFIISLL
jgi:hypothetical protein